MVNSEIGSQGKMQNGCKLTSIYCMVSLELLCCVQSLAADLEITSLHVCKASWAGLQKACTPLRFSAPY
jgi:hypothetical protein